MRRTVLSAVALAATAVLAGTAPAFADGASPTQTPSVAATEATPATSAEPTQDPATEASPVPSEAPTTWSSPSQVAEVPGGAPNTGVTQTSTDSGTPGALIGGGAAAAFAVGGAALFVVRRRRATGA
ncbi:Tat pathway signal sequence domain protein [Streptomyces sp. SID12501]|uniref:Tat pathway signal sequence domain protein n=1 Tax=Streptomyces sp. SID12501 TaxID=2706042 RepID=A0A6B3BQD5_9ACTN|nr:Tat pathway signal sequence domain protein [Streptomyces sp. SID12501]